MHLLYKRPIKTLKYVSGTCLYLVNVMTLCHFMVMQLHYSDIITLCYGNVM